MQFFAIAHDICTRICLCVQVYRLFAIAKRDLVQCEVYSPCMKEMYVQFSNYSHSLLTQCAECRAKEEKLSKLNNNEWSVRQMPFRRQIMQFENSFRNIKNKDMRNFCL